MAGNRVTLIRQLAAAGRLDDRFENIRVINCDPRTGDRKPNAGVLSVVFRADDVVTERPVAIKFFDPDLAGPSTAYRLDLFQREAQLLERLQGNPRCLQLVQPVRCIDITVTDSSTGLSLTKDVYYFVTEWVSQDIQDYFFRQQDYDALEKLYLYRDIALSVFALHGNGVYHRDLKPDNLRSVHRNGEPTVIAIDLGTAAAFDGAALGNAADYRHQVGAPIYAPLEALLGLAGNRSVGVHYDVHALGGILHDLFNPEFFFLRLRDDSGFQACYLACERHMARISLTSMNDAMLLREWGNIIQLSKRQVTIPDIQGPGHSVPPAIIPLLNKLVRSLAAIDYRDRMTQSDLLLRYVDAAIRVLNNEAAQRKRIRDARQLRQRRREKLRKRQDRLTAYLTARHLGMPKC